MFGIGVFLCLFLFYSFASDSCMTVLSEEDSLEMPYGGIKVLAIPVRIIPTATSIRGQLGKGFRAGTNRRHCGGGDV